MSPFHAPDSCVFNLAPICTVPVHLGARRCKTGATSQRPQHCASEGPSVATCPGRGPYRFLVLLVVVVFLS